MPSTTNFGWTTPADTDLVKDGASAIRTLGNGIDTSFVDLKGGTTGQVLSKNSNTDLDFTWVAQDDSDAIQNAIVDAKGDLISATAADTPARLASSGVNGQVLTVDTSTSTGLKWATPSSGAGVTWTARLALTSSIYSIAYNGSNLYVAGGSGGVLYTSSDGLTWTSRTSGFGANAIQKVYYSSGLSLWFILGDSGLISTSTDGITWTARTANMSTNAIYDAFESGGTIVAVGAGGGSTNTGGITYSTDGITWTRKSQTPTIGASYRGVTFNGTNWIVCAQASTNNALYASTPGGTWTAVSVGAATANLNAVYWDGTRHFFFRDTGVVYTTTSTTLASVTTMAVGIGSNSAWGMNYQSAYSGVIYFGVNIASGTVYATGQFTTAISSTDSTRFSNYKTENAPIITATPLCYFVGAIGRIMSSEGYLFTSF